MIAERVRRALLLVGELLSRVAMGAAGATAPFLLQIVARLRRQRAFPAG